MVDNNDYFEFADSLAENMNVTEVSEIIRQDMRRYSRSLSERNDKV